MNPSPLLPSSARHRAWAFTAAALASMALLVVAGCGKKEAATPPPPPIVEVVTVAQRDEIGRAHV